MDTTHFSRGQGGRSCQRRDPKANHSVLFPGFHRHMPANGHVQLLQQVSRQRTRFALQEETGEVSGRKGEVNATSERERERVGQNFPIHCFTVQTESQAGLVEAT